MRPIPTRVLMRPAESLESKNVKFHKWQFVKRFSTYPGIPGLVRQYASTIEFGGGLHDSGLPRDIWVCLAASTASPRKAYMLADYLDNLANQDCIQCRL